MNNAGQKIVVGGICRPSLPRRNGSSRRSVAKTEVKAGAWLVGDVLATKMPLLTELGENINFTNKD